MFLEKEKKNFFPSLEGFVSVWEDAVFWKVLKFYMSYYLLICLFQFSVLFVWLICAAFLCLLLKL